MPAKRKKSAKPKTHKHVEGSLQKSELLYKTLMENTHLGITLINTNHRIVTTNIGQGRIFKKPSRELIGKYCFKEFEKRSKVCSHCPGTRSMATGLPAEAQTEGVRDDSSRISARLRTFPVFESDGSISGFIEIVEDLTEHKQMVKKLEESEERFKAIFDNAPDGILLADAESKKFYMCNKAICKMLGYTPEEINNMKIWDIHPKEYLPAVAIDFEKRTRKEIVATEDIPLKRKDGSVFYVDINTFPITLGGKTYLTGIFRDITERKRSEENLKESEERFKAIFDNAPDGIILVDTETKKFYLGNKAFSKMLGYKPEEIKKLSVSDIHPKERLPSILKQFARQVAREITIDEGVPVKRKNGSIFYADISAFPIILSGKTYIAGIFRDVTERRRVEKKLRESKIKIRAIFDQTFQFIGLMNIDGTLIEANRAALEFSGIDSSSVLNKPFWQGPWWAHSPELQKKVRQSVGKAARGEFVRFETTHVAKDGTLHHFDFSLKPAKDETGEVIFLIPEGRDITERKKAEGALQESEERFRALAETTSDWVWEVDAKGIYTYASPKVKDLLGYEADEVVGKTPFDLMPPDEAKNISEKFRAIAKSRSPFTRLENTNLHKNGRFVVLETSGVPFFDQGEKLLGYRGIDRDVTERRKAEEELTTYREKMAQAERLASLGTLSATVAHELNQPLTVIRLSLENSLDDLKSTSCPKEVLDMLRDGLNEVSNATSIVGRFRNYARQSSRKTLCETNLGAIADRIIQLLGKMAQRAKLTLHLKGMDKLPAVHSNEKDIEQLIFALTENAIQAADGKKNHRFTIEGIVKDKDVELRFSDNCCGIATENLGRLFEPFFTTRPDGEGTGLGLPIVQRIVLGYGGKIRVSSKLGKGTTFYVTLPIHPEMSR